jgi:peptidoglycan/LPS O-acetylase OafA/YrhL
VALTYSDLRIWLSQLVRRNPRLTVIRRSIGHVAVSGEWLNAGTAGVMLFFLVSGYIVPASLERHGPPATLPR